MSGIGLRGLLIAMLLAFVQEVHAARYKIFDLGANVKPVAIENIQFEDNSTGKVNTTSRAFVAANLETPVGGGYTREAIIMYQQRAPNTATEFFGLTQDPLGYTQLAAPSSSAYSQDLKTAKTVTQSIITGLNTKGVICGWIIDTTGQEYAVYWNYNKKETIGTSNYLTVTIPPSTNPIIAPIILPPHKDDPATVYSRATGIDAQGNIVGYTHNRVTGFRRAVAWLPDYSTGSFAYKAKDLGRPIWGKKRSDGSDIPYFANEPNSRAGIALRIREGYAVGLWQTPEKDYPTPVLWNVFGVEEDAYLNVSAKLGKEIRGYVTDLIGSNYLTGFTLDALKEKSANPNVDWYDLALAEPKLDAPEDNRTATRWFATTRQQPGTDRIIITGFRIMDPLGDLGDPNAMKIFATSIRGDGIGGSAQDTSVPAEVKQPQAFLHTTQCGILNANYLFSSLDTTNKDWNLQAILAQSSDKFSDEFERVDASWFAGSGIFNSDGSRHGFVMMPALIPVDLSASLSVSPTELIVGEKLTYTINVSHRATGSAGSRATCVRVDFLNPPGVTVLDVKPFRGQCEILLAQTNCLIPYMLDGESNSITITATPRPMLADRKNNYGSVRTYSSETGFRLLFDATNQIVAEFKHDSNQFNNTDSVAIDVKREGCFIATAAYDSYLAAEVQTLRDFRDTVLRTNTLGRWLADLYYDISPPIAEWIAPRPWARTAARLILTPMVYLVAYPIVAAILFLLAATVFGFYYRRRFA